MKNLNEIKKDLNIINQIDWRMTNEQAVSRYLEWGGSWFEKDDYPVRSLNDSSTYFLINNWGEEPILYLIERSSKDTKEIAKIDIPQDLKEKFLKTVGQNKGIYPLEKDIENWLKSEFNMD